MENQQQTTTLCRAGCGFFGSPSTDGLCSKCYKDYLKRKQDTARLSPTVPAVTANSATSNIVTATTSSTALVASSTTTTCSVAESSTAATTSTIADKLREVTCSQAAKSSEDMTAKLESVAAAVEAAGGIAGSSSGTSSGVLSTSRKKKKHGSKCFRSQNHYLKGEEKDKGKRKKIKRNIIAEEKHNIEKQKAKRSVASLDAAAGTETNLNSEGQPVAKKANRCNVCKKRVGLTGFVCRCGGLYCGEHRYDTAHGCSFDYKTMEREEIRKNNPVIVSEKIQRI